MNTLLKYRNIIAAAIVLFGVVATALAAQPYNGQAWIGDHRDGDKYPLHIRVNDSTLWHNTTLTVETHNLDLNGAKCTNNWGNEVGISAAGVITVTAKAGNDPKYVGLSADIECGYVPLTGIGTDPKYTKVGVFVAATAKAGTVKYGDSKAFYLISSDNTRMVNIFVNETDATNVTIKIKPGTKITYFVDGHKLGECSNTGAADADCKIEAPTGIIFGELPTRYLNLEIKSAASPLPNPAVTIGVVVP